MWQWASASGDASNNTANLLLAYFHYPNAKSKEYTQLRQETTRKYGTITTVTLVMFLVAISAQRQLMSKGYTLSWRIPIFHSVNLYLNQIIRRNEDNAIGRVAAKVKAQLFSLYYHSGTIITVSFWVGLLTVLSLSESYNGDLIFLAKRLGRLCAVCLPTVLFLSLRPSPLPHTLYLALLPIHKWLSRIIIVQSIIHTIIYCGFFQRNHTWFKAWKTENLYGWVALFGFIAIIITSLLKIRNRAYKVFYATHYFWTWVIVICLQFHIRPEKFTAYTLVNLSILLGQIAYRVRLSRVSKDVLDVKVVNVSPNLCYVEFPNDLIADSALSPGAHIRLTLYHPNFLVRAYKQLIPNYHPYTLVSLPQDNVQKLIIRKSNFLFNNYCRYIFYGSFDPHLLFVKSNKSNQSSFSISRLAINAKKILIVVGGSAISFALPILRVMNYHGVNVKIVWVIKDYRDIAILKYFDGFVHGDDFEIFVTGNPTFDLSNKMSVSTGLNNNDYGTFEGNSQSAYNTSVDLEQQNDDLKPLLSSNHSRSFSTHSLEAGRNRSTQSLGGSRSFFSVRSAADIADRSLMQENENENVEIYIDREDEEALSDTNEDDCRADCSYIDSDEEQVYDDVRETSFNEDLHQRSGAFYDDQTSRKSRRSSSTNEAFMPYFVEGISIDQQDQQFRETVHRLHIGNKIYRGRPKLNYRYYNWCVNEEDIFTQCSGPVEDASGNHLICCKDLPRRTRIDSNEYRQLTPDASKVWVVSAGPKGLVKNVKLWATENGLKFHEEAFYV